MFILSLLFVFVASVFCFSWFLRKDMRNHTFYLVYYAVISLILGAVLFCRIASADSTPAIKISIYVEELDQAVTCKKARSIAKTILKMKKAAIEDFFRIDGKEDLGTCLRIVYLHDTRAKANGYKVHLAETENSMVELGTAPTE